jgi:DNA-binding MarR family transcriptional regulator
MRAQSPARVVAALEDVAVLVRRLPADPALSLTTAAALRAIVTEGPQRVTVLGERLGVTQPAITQLVDRLVADGLAERAPDPADRRAVLVRPTQAGTDVVRRRRASRARGLAALLDQLTADERSDLERALPVLERLARALR